MMTIKVYGLPAPKGSKRFVGMSKAGRGILVESSKREKPWAEAVKWAARELMASLYPDVGCIGFPGPVDVEMIFTMPKPKSAPKTRRTLPDRKPDIDKLVRSTSDALTAAGAYEDDARIVKLVARKVFPSEGVDALHVPGAVIRIEAAA